MTYMKDLSKKNKLFTPMLKVFLKRGSYVESVHNVHAVICDNKGRVLMQAGNDKHETFIRSALKPFQAIPFISSGAYEKARLDDGFWHLTNTWVHTPENIPRFEKDYWLATDLTIVFATPSQRKQRRS